MHPSGGTYYLFDKNTLQPIGEPVGDARRTCSQAPRREAAAEHQVIEVPQGTVVVEDKPERTTRTTDVDESATGSQFFVLHDRPALTGNDITNPKQSTDQINQPNVNFDFTDRAARSSRTSPGDRPARRRRLLRRHRPAVRRHRLSQADQFSGSFAIVLDGEVISRPIINFVDNPDGIDGRTGAQISASSRVQEAQDLAEMLKIGALPIKLALISQSTVSATLGQEALDQGIRRA